MNLIHMTGAAIVLLGSVSVSAAETLDCTCVTNQTPEQNYPVIGTVSDSSGSVMYSGSTGFVEAKTGTLITPGSQINVGPGAKARVQVGSNCNLAATQNTEISILQPEGQDGPICVKVSEANFGTAQFSESATFAQANPNGGDDATTGLLIAGGAAAGIVAITCIGWCQDDGGPRPATPDF